MYNEALVNPALVWPFLQRSDIAYKIYDLRLSFCLPVHTVYISNAPRTFSVYLDSVVDGQLIFKATDYILNITDIVTYAHGLFTDTQGWLDIYNSFVDMSLDISDASDINLLVCAACLLISSKCISLSLCSALPGALPEVLRKLHFMDGHNTQVSYDKGVLHVKVDKALATPVLYKGALSINGLSNSVLIIPGPSVRLTTTSEGSTITLALSANKA